LTAETLTRIYAEVARRVDGAALVEEALASEPTPATHLLAIGKVALPMFEGWRRARPDPGAALLVPPEAPADPLPDGARVVVADHPHPSERSVAAARAARVFVEGLAPADRLVVLLSGGGSSLLALPAGPLSLEDKRATVAAVARAGATIAELNTVRKHLSAIKGGQLGAATGAPTLVLALSDVVGNDPATIASGPFSPDPTTFAQALALVRRLAPDAPAAARHWLERGAAGGAPETPKPGDPRLAHVQYRVLAGPERAVAEARRSVEATGAATGELSANTEEPVEALAAGYAARARHELSQGGGPRGLIGNGEPRIVVRGDGRGGRCTHLALLMARALAGLAGVAFLAAGTDRSDGIAEASGAVVDGATWERALRAGLDPQGALDRCDSAAPLAALGCLVRGPGRSNLLDLHLMGITGSS
jgi:glycerate 2-kinase